MTASGGGPTEKRLGTHKSIFFYAGPFRYPNTFCGLLFAPSLEPARRDDGAASPFDSGGLLKHCQPSNSAEDPKDFLARHELAIPEHRTYLAQCLERLFDDPWEYVSGKAPAIPSPIGLTGGDERRWTHEVRINSQVPLSSHLKAVFATLEVIDNHPSIEKLFRFCANNGIDRIEIDTPGFGTFDTLQRECSDYLKKTIL